MTRILLTLAESGFIPDVLIKIAARYISNTRLNQQRADASKDQIISALSRGAVAEKTFDANEQHYEVPPKFFYYVLGPNLKYSCSLFNDVNSLDDAEESMLKLYIDRADIKDGHEVLDLGCGWGSFSFYVAERYPDNFEDKVRRDAARYVPPKRRFKPAPLNYGQLRTYLDRQYESPPDNPLTRDIYSRRKSVRTIIREPRDMR